MLLISYFGLIADELCRMIVGTIARHSSVLLWLIISQLKWNLRVVVSYSLSLSLGQNAECVAEVLRTPRSNQHKERR